MTQLTLAVALVCGSNSNPSLSMRHTFATVMIGVALSANGAALREAQFTRVINEVKKLPEQAPPQTAAVGDKITGKTAVSTGAKSRAELKFGDGTLTRLGANSIFSLEQESRTIDLQQGTLLLQVPKQMGGAKVRTAAVTAAVTGTTILVEYEPNGYIKVIVLEGSLDLFRNDKPSEFRTIKAGDMVIMKPDGKFIPEPVQVDLERLKNSSKLTNAQEFDPLGNDQHLRDADQEQQQRKQKGELLQTSLEIPGQGVRVTLSQEARQRITNVFGVRNGSPPQPQGGPSLGGPTGTPGQSHPPHLGGQAVISDGDSIITDPTITASFNGTVATGKGSVFVSAVDGGLGPYLFNRPTTSLVENTGGIPATVDGYLLRHGAWAAFLMDDMIINGKPRVDTTGGSKNLILASSSNIWLTGHTPGSVGFTSGHWNLDGPPSDVGISPATLNALTLAARGDIVWDPQFTLSGTSQDVLLYTQGIPGGKTGDVTIVSYTYDRAANIPSGTFNIAAAGDIDISVTDGAAASPKNLAHELPIGFGNITAREVKMSAGGSASVGSRVKITASEKLHITAKLDLTISSSAELKRIINSDPLDILLASARGDVTVGDASGTAIVDGKNVEVRSDRGNVSLNNANLSAADVLKVTTLGRNGDIIIGNSTLTAAHGIDLYAQGSSGNVHFVANSTLDGPSTIAGSTVLIDSGVGVDVTQPNALRVYSNHHLYNDGSHGNFTNGGSNVRFTTGTAPGARQGDFNSYQRK